MSSVIVPVVQTWGTRQHLRTPSPTLPAVLDRISVGHLSGDSRLYTDHDEAAADARLILHEPVPPSHRLPSLRRATGVGGSTPTPRSRRPN